MLFKGQIGPVTVREPSLPVNTPGRGFFFIFLIKTPGAQLTCTHMPHGRVPCDSWWFQRSSRPRTGTSNPRGRTAPPPVVA